MIRTGNADYQKSVAEKIVQFQQAAKQWWEFVLEHEVTSLDYVVLLVSQDEEINYYTLRFLDAFQKKNKGRKFFIVSLSAAMEEFVKMHTTVPYQFVSCKQEVLNSFAKLYGIYNFTPRLIVNSFELSADTNAFQLVDERITKADVVALVVLHLDEVPEQTAWRRNNPSLPKIPDRKAWIPNPKISVQKPRIPDSNSEKQDDIQYELPYAPNGENDLEKIVKHALDPLLKNGKITKQDRIVLFGVTQTARCAAEQLKDYQVSAFWDNSEQLEGAIVDGIPVERPQAQDGNVKILVASRRYQEICRQLYALGYELGKQIFVIFSVRLNGDLSKETLQRLVEKHILEGKKVYEDIRSRYPKETIFVRPWQGTGDIYLLGGYIDEILENNRTDKYVLTVPSMSIKKTIELFGVNAIICRQEDAFKMLQFGRLMGFEKLGMVSLNDNLDQRDLVRIRGYKGLDSHTLFQKLVFRCRERVTDFHFYQENSDEIFDRYELPKGRTVLLSPYAITIDEIPMERWERMAEKLMQKGVTVCTNVSSDREVPIKDTQGIFIPYKQIVDFIEKAGGFIGLRNGLCDIISSSHARLTAIYPKHKPQKDSFYYRCYSLKKLGLRNENLLELEYDEELTDAQIDEIVEFMGL